ncbi:MAG: arginine deiminase-related protein, partial [Bacteroidota bacterium]|nr:arginine deiminase-related protein [Bacteroidota bacterium]
MKQTTDKLLMIRPDCFYANEKTATNNYFQERTRDNRQSTTIKAQQEFDDFVDVLKVNGVKVYVWQDAKEPITPDALFPNNWISFHNPSTMISYPMFAPNRQLEVSDAPIEFLASNGFSFNNKIDFTPHISS